MRARWQDVVAIRPGFLVWLVTLSVSWGACQGQTLRFTDEEALELGRRDTR